jgi:hypothetical protein
VSALQEVHSPLLEPFPDFPDSCPAAREAAMAKAAAVVIERMFGVIDGEEDDVLTML